MGGKLSLEPQNAPEYRPVVGTKCATYLSLRARGDNSLQLLLGLETDNIVVSIAENPFKEEGVDPSLQASLKGMSQRASTNHPPPSMNEFFHDPPPPPSTTTTTPSPAAPHPYSSSVGSAWHAEPIDACSAAQRRWALRSLPAPGAASLLSNRLHLSKQ